MPALAGVAVPRVVAAAVGVLIPSVALWAGQKPGLSSLAVGALAASSVAAGSWGASPGWRLLRLGRARQQGTALDVSVTRVEAATVLMLAGASVGAWAWASDSSGVVFALVVSTFGMARAGLYLYSEYQRGLGRASQASWAASGAPSLLAGLAFVVWMILPEPVRAGHSGIGTGIAFALALFIVAIVAYRALPVSGRLEGCVAAGGAKKPRESWVGAALLAILASAGPLVAPLALTPLDADIYAMGDRAAALVVLPQLLVNYLVVQDLSATSPDRPSIQALALAARRSTLLALAIAPFSVAFVVLVVSANSAGVVVIVVAGQLVGVTAGPSFVGLLLWGFGRDVALATSLSLMVLGIGALLATTPLSLAMAIALSVVVLNAVGAVLLRYRVGAWVTAVTRVHG